MGKKSRTKAALRGATPTIVGEVPVVSGRSDCPCGSGRRYRLCHGATASVVEVPRRPFLGLPNEVEWVAMRELVPAGTATVDLLPAAVPADGTKTATIASVLPMGWAAMHRNDGHRFAGLQTSHGTSDPALAAGRALSEALSSEAGQPVAAIPAQGPHLRDLIDTSAPFEVQVHQGFEFWMEDGQDLTSQVRESLQRANDAVIPTAKLAAAPAAYWCQIGARTHLRWVLPHDEEPLLDALARLHSTGGLAVVPDARFMGTFRAHGLLVPVWDLPTSATAEALEEPVAELAKRLDEAAADTTPLTAAQRQARAGVAARQVTLR